jgi:hypothetical protein
MSWLRDLICGKPDGEGSNILKDISGVAKNFNANNFQIITPDEFVNMANQEFGAHLTKIEEPSDHFYYLLPYSVQTQFNNVYGKYKPSYVTELFDCDNFALDYLAFLHRLANKIPNAKYSFAAGMGSGIFHWVSGFHRANVVIFEDRKVRLFEANQLKTYYKEHWEGNEFRIIYF